MECITTTHLVMRHNCDINLPQLLGMYQDKKNRRWIKLTLKKIEDYCGEIRVMKGRRLGRPARI